MIEEYGVAQPIQGPAHPAKTRVAEGCRRDLRPKSNRRRAGKRLERSKKRKTGIRRDSSSANVPRAGLRYRHLLGMGSRGRHLRQQRVGIERDRRQQLLKLLRRERLGGPLLRRSGAGVRIVLPGIRLLCEGLLCVRLLRIGLLRVRLRLGVTGLPIPLLLIRRVRSVIGRVLRVLVLRRVLILRILAVLRRSLPWLLLPQQLYLRQRQQRQHGRQCCETPKRPCPATGGAAVWRNVTRFADAQAGQPGDVCCEQVGLGSHVSSGSSPQDHPEAKLSVPAPESG